ncbi:MAG: type I restriction-modification system subunit M [Oscillospiraceae bacterium]|nr:type I restriction-modification system subunit M [Oscillospiraceae bacterium]
MTENSKDLLTVLWSGADILRGKMDANDYKNYLLGIVFYKYLSDTFLYKVYDLKEDKVPETMEQAQKAYEEIYASEDRDALLQEVKEECHYIIEPSLTFTKLADDVNTNQFQRENLKKAFNDVETSDVIFAGLFADVDLYSTKLGSAEQKQNDTIADLIEVINTADLMNRDGDVLGNAYEYMIGKFASETGKKAGEFYTPQAVSRLLTQIAIHGQEDKKGLSVYDPTMGSGSLLLNAKKYSKYPEYIRYYGQELMTSTYNLARMNMFLHGVAPENQHLKNGDTLDADWPTNELTNFDMVLMNPPYSQVWKPVQGFVYDPRFEDYGGVLAPKSKADYAFLLHGFYHLKRGGTMAIVLPHGVLFRGGTEKTIRRVLLNKGFIYAVIGLPANLFYNTSIPTTIIVLKKDRDGRDVLMIDASKQFIKEKKKNLMTPENIAHILKLYLDRTDVKKEAHLASYEEIKKNDFNLNIPRYVDTFEPEPEISLSELADDMKKTGAEIAKSKESLLSMMKELDADSPEEQAALSDFLKVMEDM